MQYYKWIFRETANNTAKVSIYARFEHLSSIFQPSFKPRASGFTLRPLVSTKRVAIKAGNGGSGCIAFERLFCNPQAGPSGGDGGSGGHVIFQADSNIKDLSHIPSIIQAENGCNGHGGNRHGANANHLYLKVPIGTHLFSIIKSSNDGAQTETKQLCGVLKTAGDMYLAARGGAGGKGNCFLTNSTYNQINTTLSPKGKNTPLRVAERGAIGESCKLSLRISHLADIGLIGAPNAGKSTLLQSLTRARPKIAPYPFTTLKPHLGVLRFPVSFESENRNNDAIENCAENIDKVNVNEQLCSVTIADLPGIIKGAAKYNKGLGAEFLGLIPDCQLMAYVIDCGTIWVLNDRNSDNLFENIYEQISSLYQEILEYDPLLANKSKCLILGTKVDLISTTGFDSSTKMDNEYTKLIAHLENVLYKAACEAGVIDWGNSQQVMLVSGRHGYNIENLMYKIRHFVQSHERT